MVLYHHSSRSEKSFFQRCRKYSTILLIISSLLLSLSTLLGNIFPRKTLKLGETEDGFKNVEIINQVNGIIDIYDESRIVVASLSNYKKVIIRARLGRVLYAVMRKGQQRIGQSIVHPSVDSYSFFVRRNTTNPKRSIKRLNIAAVHRQHPSLVAIGKKHSDGQWTSFHSLSSRTLDLYARMDGESVLTSRLLPEKTQLGQYFPSTEIRAVATAGRNRSQTVSEVKIQSGIARYYFDDPEKPTVNSALIKIAQKERKFAAKYFNRTGIPWMHYFGPNGPRPPPIHFMWPTKTIGDVHQIVSAQGYWSCPQSHEQCQSKNSIELRLEVVSIKPKVLIIDDFLNEFEAQHVIALAKVGEKDSVVSGEGTRSEIRTSSNSWVYRESDAVIDSLHKRAADLLQVDDKLLHAHSACEPLQIVHYETGEKYGEHHDWFPGMNYYFYYF